MMKKLIMILLVCLMVCTMAVGVMADEVPVMTITTSSNTPSVGDTITVTVSISETENCTSAGLGITFDANALEMVENSFTALVESTQANCKYNSIAKAYVVSIQFESAQKVSGELFSFQLKVKDAASFGGTYEISGMASIRISGANAKCNVAAASVSIVCTHEYDNACDTSCNLCGDTRKAKHTYDDGEVTQKPTCAAEGVKTFTCTACGDKKTEAVAKLEHTYNDGEVTTDATCEKEGEKTFTCTGCGDITTEKIKKKSHSYDEGKITTEATCTEEGVKTYTCSGCGNTKTEAVESKGHSYDGGKVTTEATCTGEGVKTITCTVCGKEKTEAIESKGHSYDDGVVTVEPTCTTDGEKTITCTVCGKVKTEVILTEGHAYDHDCDTDCNACGEQRQTEHNYSELWSADESGHWHACTGCGEVLELMPHTPGPNPTETEDQICLDCGFVLQPAGTHIHEAVGDWLSDENGHWHMCSCEELLDREAHTWDEGVLDEVANVITYTCTVCGQPKLEDVQQPTETEPSVPQAPTQKPSAPQEPSEPKDDKPAESFPWQIVVAVVGVLLVAATVFIIVGILRSKKKTGKYTAE